ncbi:hypothetical protein L3Q82_020530, partial [Scortum barcoo]
MRAVARRFAVSVSVVSRAWRRYQETGQYIRRRGRGRRRATTQFLQDEGIDAMDWSARSPDLNPTEHIWDIMSRSIHQLPHCTTDCPGVGGCFSPGLGGDPSGDHLPPHQEHASGIVGRSYRHVEATHTTEPHFD